MNSEYSYGIDAGSFRDRDGRIYQCGNRILRGISQGALADYRKLVATEFFRYFSDAGKLVATREVPAEDVPLPEEEKIRWAGFLEHERVPVISYAYEWTFGMLQDAALLTLDLLEAALKVEMTLKDATPYNIQFVNGRPVFIDIPSFETLAPGGTWSGYRQFCEMFLFPLMLQAYKDIDIQPIMRSRIDGIGIQTMARMFGFWDRFKGGVLTHVWLQAKLDNRYGSTSQDVKSELRSAGFKKELILVNVRKTRKLVRKLSWGGQGSEWGNYQELHNYSETDHKAKEDFIDNCTHNSGAKTVWDIGANTGQFSHIAAKHAQQVLAMDSDHFAVERMYRENIAKGVENILPLVQNVCDPSPIWGWRNRERNDLVSRARPDLVLCLALIHHVVISANVPLDEFIAWLASLTNQLVIEYISRSDEKGKTLLRNKVDKYHDYSHKNLKIALGMHFEIREKLSLESGDRFLYWCIKV
ncbi:MAG: class I SAM-dependent methyltransferase [Lysobacterales bacterium]